MKAYQQLQARRVAEALWREVLLVWARESKQPVSTHVRAVLREYGTRCYMQGLLDGMGSPTLPAPPEVP